MVSALLLPLLLAGSPDQPSAVQDDPPIQLWINNDRRFLPGDRAKVQVRTDYDGYLIVLHVDTEGYLRVLFPIDPDKDNFVRGGKKYEVRGRGGRETFEADGKGGGTVYAAVSREPFGFDGFILGDHWDYRTLAPDRLAGHPEAELNDLVRRMALGSFDYDILGYEVVERVVYASDYTSRHYGWTHYEPWCGFSCARPYFGHISIGLFFGRPYRRYYYDPYFYAYDPYYNPFFYDPYYYAPVYRPWYWYPYRYHYGHPRVYYHPRYRSYDGWYTPYRFRGGDGWRDGYRDRRYDLRRSVNTVYRPPLSTVREPPVANPVRRMVEPPAEELPSGVARRRLVDDVRRVQDRPVEARRSRVLDDPGRAAPEARTRRELAPGRHDERREPRLERRREEPRSVERPRQRDRTSERRSPEARAPERRPSSEARAPERRPSPEARAPRPEPGRGTAAPARDRSGFSGGRSEGRGSDGGRRRR